MKSTTLFDHGWTGFPKTKQIWKKCALDWNTAESNNLDKPLIVIENICRLFVWSISRPLSATEQKKRIACYFNTLTQPDD